MQLIVVFIAYSADVLVHECLKVSTVWVEVPERPCWMKIKRAEGPALEASSHAPKSKPSKWRSSSFSVSPITAISFVVANKPIEESEIQFSCECIMIQFSVQQQGFESLGRNNWQTLVLLFEQRRNDSREEDDGRSSPFNNRKKAERIAKAEGKVYVWRCGQFHVHGERMFSFSPPSKRLRYTWKIVKMGHLCVLYSIPFRRFSLLLRGPFRLSGYINTPTSGSLLFGLYEGAIAKDKARSQK